MHLLSSVSKTLEMRSEGARSIPEIEVALLQISATQILSFVSAGAL